MYYFVLSNQLMIMLMVIVDITWEVYVHVDGESLKSLTQAKDWDFLSLFDGGEFQWKSQAC